MAYWLRKDLTFAKVKCLGHSQLDHIDRLICEILIKRPLNRTLTCKSVRWPWVVIVLLSIFELHGVLTVKAGVLRYMTINGHFKTIRKLHTVISKKNKSNNRYKNRPMRNAELRAFAVLPWLIIDYLFRFLYVLCIFSHYESFTQI